MLLAEISTVDAGLTGTILAGIGTACTAVGFAMYKLVKYLMDRIVNKENGLATIWVSKQCEFFDGLLRRFDRQQELCTHHGKSIDKIIQAFPCGSRFETCETNRGVIGLAQAALLRLDADELTDEQREAVVKELTGTIERLKTHNDQCDSMECR